MVSPRGSNPNTENSAWWKTGGSHYKIAISRLGSQVPKHRAPVGVYECACHSTKRQIYYYNTKYTFWPTKRTTSKGKQNNCTWATTRVLTADRYTTIRSLVTLRSQLCVPRLLPYPQHNLNLQPEQCYIIQTIVLYITNSCPSATTKHYSSIYITEQALNKTKLLDPYNR